LTKCPTATPFTHGSARSAKPRYAPRARTALRDLISKYQKAVDDRAARPNDSLAYNQYLYCAETLAAFITRNQVSYERENTLLREALKAINPGVEFMDWAAVPIHLHPILKENGY
jgi:hypothetical protein